MAKNKRNYANRWAKYQIFDKEQEQVYHKMKKVQQEEEKKAAQTYEYTPTHQFRSMLQYYTQKFNFAGQTPIFAKMQKIGQNYQRRYELYKSKTRRNSFNPGGLKEAPNSASSQWSFLTIDNFKHNKAEIKKTPRESDHCSSQNYKHYITVNTNSIFDQNRKFLLQTAGDNFFFSENDSQKNLTHQEKRNKIVEKWKSKLNLQEVREKTSATEMKKGAKTKISSRNERSPGPTEKLRERENKSKRTPSPQISRRDIRNSSQEGQKSPLREYPKNKRDEQRAALIQSIHKNFNKQKAKIHKDVQRIKKVLTEQKSLASYLLNLDLEQKDKKEEKNRKQNSFSVTRMEQDFGITMEQQKANFQTKFNKKVKEWYYNEQKKIDYSTQQLDQKINKPVSRQQQHFLKLKIPL